MATEKIGIYRRWLEPAPKENGVQIPKERWPKERRHSWEVRWFGTMGKRYSKSFETRKKAERFLRKLQEEINCGKSDKPQNITLHDFITEHRSLMKGQVAHATLVDQMRVLKLFENFIGGSTLLSKIHSRQAEAFISKRLNSKLSVATVNKDIRTLKRIFNLAIDPRGYLYDNQNPFQKIKQRKISEKVVNYMTVINYQKLVDSLGSNWWKALISIAYCCGLRRNEILNLTWADIDFENQYIRIGPKDAGQWTIEWEPKDHECRVVPMPDETSQFLANLQADSPLGFSYVFISPERLSRIHKKIKQGDWKENSEVVNNLLQRFQVLCSRAGVGKCTIHDLRRAAITNWAQNLPIQVVQQLAGHSNITTTKKYYLFVRPENMEFASKTINKMLEEAKKQLTQK